MVHYTQMFDSRRLMYRHLFPKDGVGAEIGVLTGDNACVLIQETRPAKLYLIDCWDLGKKDNDSIEHWRRYYLRTLKTILPHPEVEIYKGFAAPLSSRFEHNSLDWVYLDARFGYECVLEDFWAYYRKVKPGGIIAGHWDITGDKKFTGVKRVVSEMLNERVGELVGFTRDNWGVSQDNWRSYAMRVNEKIEVSE